jgi:hypothetical protein
MGQKALQPLLHPAHPFQVQRDRVHDFHNIYIPDELELQSSKTLVAVVVGIWETGYTVPQLRALASGHKPTSKR